MGCYRNTVDLVGKSRVLLWGMIVLNVVVLAGQLWPEGAPPFAMVVNIGFLALSLVVLLARTRQ